jgi:hypothetical protein
MKLLSIKFKKVTSSMLAIACVCSLGVTVSCAGAKLQSNAAQEVIARQLDVPPNQVHVSSLSEVSNTALVETVLRMTFVLQKDSSGKWRVVRMQHSADKWETPEEFIKSIEQSQFQKSLENAFEALLIEPSSP